MDSNRQEDQTHRRHLALSCLAAGFFVLVTVWLTWPMLPRMSNGISTNADALLNYWALAWNFHILPLDPLSYFNANIFFPRADTLAYSEHLFGVALLGWPARLLSGSDLFAYNFVVLTSFVLSGLGMYLLVHEITGSRWAAAFSGLFFLAAPYRFLHLLHIQNLSMQWFPFVFLYLFRFLRDGRVRQAVAVAVFTLLQVLSCNYYAVYLALALVLFAVVVIGFRLVTGSLLDIKKVGILTVVALAVSILALPFALPYERNRDEGFYRRYEDVVQFSAHPSDYLRPSSLNRVFYVDYLPRQERSEKALFPGVVVVLFAGLGLTSVSRLWPDGTTNELKLALLFFAAVTGVGFLLSFGPELRIGGETTVMPYRFLYRHLPGFHGMRVPARLAVLVLLGLGVLSGLGLSRILGRFPRFQPWMGCAILGIALFEYQTYSLERLLSQPPRHPPVYDWLADQPGDFGVLELPIHEDIAKESIRMYHSTVHWKNLANGFSGWWPNDYWVLAGRMRHFPTSRILQFLERDVPVRYVIIHYAQYPDARRRQLERDMERYRERIPRRARFGQDAIYEILPDTRQ